MTNDEIQQAEMLEAQGRFRELDEFLKSIVNDANNNEDRMSAAGWLVTTWVRNFGYPNPGTPEYAELRYYAEIAVSSYNNANPEAKKQFGGQMQLVSDILRQTASGEPIQPEERQFIIKRANKRIWIGWGFAVLGIVMGIVMTQNPEIQRNPNAPPIVMQIPLMIYVCWASYWGFSRTWGWARSFLRNFGFEITATPIGWLIMLTVFCSCFLYVAMLYGSFGGGIYEYLKMRRIANGNF